MTPTEKALAFLDPNYGDRPATPRYQQSEPMDFSDDDAETSLDDADGLTLNDALVNAFAEQNKRIAGNALAFCQAQSR